MSIRLRRAHGFRRNDRRDGRRDDRRDGRRARPVVPGHGPRPGRLRPPARPADRCPSPAPGLLADTATVLAGTATVLDSDSVTLRTDAASATLRTDAASATLRTDTAAVAEDDTPGHHLAGARPGVPVEGAGRPGGARLPAALPPSRPDGGTTCPAHPPAGATAGAAR